MFSLESGLALFPSIGLLYKTEKQNQTSKKAHLSAIAHTDRSLHTLYQKGNKTQPLFWCKKEEMPSVSVFPDRFFFFAWFFICIPLYICQECKGTKTPGHLHSLPQLSGRYWQTKTATVRFYFTLVRIAIITGTSVIIPFDVWWKKTKKNKLWQEHKELWALCIANRNMKCWSLCKRLVFHHKGKCGIAIWHGSSDVWYALKALKTSLKHFTQLFIAEILTRAKRWKPPEYLSTSRWLC